MNRTGLSNESQRKNRIATHFRNVNMFFLVLILVFVFLLATVIVRGITRDVSKDYAYLYASEAVEKFNSYINKDLALVRKAANSKAVHNWLVNEDTPSRKSNAYDEIMGYADLFDNALIYIGVQDSLNAYVADSGTKLTDLVYFESLAEDDPDNIWYYNCINSDEDYTLNVDIDNATDIPRLWINHKVVDDGRVLGVFCSGLPADKVLSELFGNYDNENVRGFIIDKYGRIRLDSYLPANKALFEEENNNIYIHEFESDPVFAAAIDSYLGRIDGTFDSSMEPEVVKLQNSAYGYATIVPISGTDWTVVTYFDSDSLFSITNFLTLLIVMLFSFILYAAMNSVLMRRLILLPLEQLTDSVSHADTDNSYLYGSDRNDELGDLSRTIQGMRDRINSYASEILLGAQEMERQRRLLQAVNETATVLLAADGDKFDESLQEGMGLMARCVDIDRVCIWKNMRKDDVLHCTRKFRWVSNPELLGAESEITFSYADTLPEWEGKFLNGECINSPLSKLPQAEQQFLKPLGAKSVLGIPVYLQDRLWGFISFDDCQKEHAFTEDEVNILQSGSLMLANAIHRKDTEDKMREADERTKLMLDATPLCCGIWNETFQNVDCNEEVVRLFGLKDKQEYSDRFSDLSPEYQPNGRLSSEMAFEKLGAAMREGKMVFEWMHQRLDGTPIPAEITLVRVKLGEGHVIAGYTRDMREQKKMINAIEYKDILLHTVNKAAAVLLEAELDEFESDLWRCMGMLAEAVNVDRVYIWKNHIVDGELYCTQLYEWSESAKPQQGEEIAVDIPYSENIPGWQETLSNDRCVNGRVRNMSQAEQDQLSPQGILSILVVPVFLQDDFWGFVGFDDCHNERIFSSDEESILRASSLLIANALLRHEMTQNIHTEAVKMDAIVSNYPGIIYSLDKNSIFTLFNGLQLKMMGVTPKAFEGKSIDAFIKANWYYDIVERIQKTFDGDIQDWFTEWLSEVEDTIYHAHTTPIYDSNGNITGVVGTLEDVTSTIHLQKKLEKAVDEAQSASRAKSNFLSNMSHEMRTPMNAIIGMSAIGKSASDIEKKNYAFGKIDDASNHLLGVINDVLDMSKIEANKFELSDAEFNFEKVLQKAVNVITFRVDEKKQNFSVHLDNKIPQTLVGDDQHLTQVITNLLSNAVKFTPEQGSIWLDTHFVKEEDGICTIQIEVTDTGIGINVEQQVRLFHSFEQAENNTSRKFGGTGLGLAISKNVVELMGGSIWIESELGKGSTFAFTVRMKRGKKEYHSMLAPGVNWKNMRVLVVDDDLRTCEYFASIAEQFGIACDIATGGEQALELINAKGAYDIYFVDWSMPGMSGIKLSDKIKARGEDESVIIMISATGWDEIEDEAKAVGVDKYLPKPLFPSSIADTINDCIGLENSYAAAEIEPDEIISFRGHRILLAEDIEINSEIMVAMLEPTEIEVECAVNGIEALSMFNSDPERYDLIFMDIQMPEMDGLESTRRIRALDIPRAKEIPIIAMTANVFKEDIEKCLEAGMNDHVGKPIDIEIILSKIKHYLD